MSKIILFDGVCNFCSSSVKFIIKRDKLAKFKFGSLQSKIGQELKNNTNLPENTDSIILIEDGKSYDKSTAALRISKELDGLWKLFYMLIIIPKPLRDIAYNYLAKNRYKWFGKKNECMLPSPEIRSRFLQDGQQ
ncbi:thiol-disulfide oxidoreductase DCC family protein [Oceanobacillus chungangensis]|uniref:Thiol-disulfide oxidoreductase n=1 Tax=Oceanobacillus chungangensis TaxID=1229152 RepID=A0A3D8PNP0_9BACI|nr:thiol-disulfide oxidoreductase DCC family protein [Oceanobacillus chungangensis]RDW17726.1 thiol-disulfide oxidoreductase [Oceanobacillus chungangensis]